VGRVARGEDVAGSEIYLEPRHAEGGACWRADFCGEIRKRRQVVACERGRYGELTPGNLHTVSRVASEAHDGARECLGRVGVVGGDGNRLCHESSSVSLWGALLALRSG